LYICLDLQWCDRNSLLQIEHFISHTECRNVLIIGSYRSDEIDTEHPLLTLITNLNEHIINIDLQPLSSNSINSLIVETLSCTSTRAETLVKYLITNTNGNPFHCIQLLQSMYSDGYLYFQNPTLDNLGCWMWTFHDMEYNNVVALVTEKITRLSTQTQRLLTYASCLGDKFLLDILALVAEVTPLEALSGRQHLFIYFAFLFDIYLFCLLLFFFVFRYD
jgi:predicted ATPase